MLNRWYLFLHDTGDWADVQALADGAAPVYVIGEDGFGRVLDHVYGPAGNHAFAVALSGEVGDIGALVLLLSHPFYARGFLGRPLFMPDGFGGGLKEALLRQGIEADIRVVAGAGLDRVYCVGKKAMNVVADYGGYCLSAFDASDVFVAFERERVAAAVGSLARFRAEHPVLYERTLAYVALLTEQERLSRAERLLREENGILQELLELAGRSDEVNYILQFYKYEYEILPLWYKRFGHILKVMMGKRSFRSLFDKKAKKYLT